jgi:hypothetical protein
MKTPTPGQREKRYAKVYDYARPYESDAYALDPHGHGWDRLAALAGEYARGERPWAETKRMLDENAADLTRLAQQAEQDTEQDAEQADQTAEPVGKDS